MRYLVRAAGPWVPLNPYPSFIPVPSEIWEDERRYNENQDDENAEDDVD